MDMKELTDFILYLFEARKEEDIYELYLFKTIFSDIGYKEFRDAIKGTSNNKVKKKMGEKEEKKAIDKAEKILGR